MTASVIAACLSLAAALVSGLVLFNLHAMTRRMDNQDARMDKLEAKQAAQDSHKTACRVEFVSKEDWVRSEGYTRKEIKDLTVVLLRIEGRLDVVDKLPALAGQIAGQIAAQMKGSHND